MIAPAEPIGRGRSADSLVIRPLADADSMNALTLLLHKAYASLREEGISLVAARQDECDTRRRAAKGECYVGDLHGELVATATLIDADKTYGTPWLESPTVFSIGQFAVLPRYQRCGIGSLMLAAIEARAIAKAARHLALDTPERAIRLIYFYKKRGYRIIERVNWSGRPYVRVIMSKPLGIEFGIPIP